MSKHTPGPWIIERRADQRSGTHVRAPKITRDGANLGVSIARITTGVGEDTTANACLISAAPDMLEALKAIQATSAYLLAMGGGDATEKALRLMSAAIAKAEGKAS